MPSRTVRPYTKHDPQKLARRILKLGGTVKGPQIGGYAERRAAIREGIVVETGYVALTGKRGRPSVLYRITRKGRKLAEREG
jgi:hypothetical protein